MTCLEIPSRRRDPPMWAVVAGAPSEDAAWTAWTSSGSGSIVSFHRGLEFVGSYIVGGSGTWGDFLGVYDGHPAWAVGAGFLFHSRTRGKWVLRRNAFMEPMCWTRTVLKADGTTEERAYGDSWYEASNLVATDGKVSLAAAGKAVEDARIAGDPHPDPAEIAVPEIWKNGESGLCGEYSPVAGTGATGDRRVGHWSWQVDGDAVFAMDPGDRTRVVDAASGGATPCPDGKWAVRAGGGGAWVADLSGADYGSGLTPAWVPDAGAPADGEAPRVEWAGLAAVPSGDVLYVYQPSRFL